jgi:hypothetical protein
MSEMEQRPEEERRMRRAAVTAAMHQTPPVELDPAAVDDEEAEDNSAAAQRHDQRQLWVDAQIRNAMARGDFDNLPGTGKPIPGIDAPHDPNWWVKRLIERENITGVLPPALALRREDAELEELVDREATEADVRRVVEDFNHRVVEARRQLLGGPPVITATRDVEQEVAGWRARRQARRNRPASPPVVRERKRRWWRRR